jgi:hypothetical protein
MLTFDLQLFISDPLSDRIWFTLFEVSIFVITLWSILRVNVFCEQSPVSALNRGSISWKFLRSVAYGIITFIVSVIFEMVPFLRNENELIMFYILNCLCVFYLCFLNEWSTNKFIGLLVKIENANLNPHGR